MDNDFSDLNDDTNKVQSSSDESGALRAASAAAAINASYSASDTTGTDDDTKLLIINDDSAKKKKSWTGRFNFGRKSPEKKEKVETALQEDSSVSSWSRGDSSPDNSLNLYTSSARGTDEMPAELKAFGEDHGLAAAELAMEEEDSEAGSKSSDSLRDELDRAIETGDWAAVEKQTSEMLVLPKNVSDVDSDAYENESLDGLEQWSNGHASDDDTEVIDDERIEILEKLIETDDWQGIVSNSQIHTKLDDSMDVDDEDN